MAIKVIIADDHPAFRAGLAVIFKGLKEIKVIGEASNGEEAIALINGKETVDVLLLDLQMPVMDGYQVLEKLKKQQSKAKVIVMSMFADEGTIIKVVENGANGFIAKEAEIEEWLLALKSVLTKGVYFNEKATKAMSLRLRTGKQIKPGFRGVTYQFSEKEIKVIELLAKGYSSQQIGKQLNLSQKTIEFIRGDLIQKVGAKNSMSLVVFAIKHGIIKI